MVFRDLGQIPISAGEPYTSATGEDSDITAVIGLAGSAKGAVAISLNKAVALKLADTLSGGTHTAINQNVIDVLGEIANIIAGRAKQIMENEFRFETALPVVVLQDAAKGRGLSLNWPNSSVCNICIPFTIFENESFILSVSVQKDVVNKR
jgi:chemotaxis protein CheX